MTTGTRAIKFIILLGIVSLFADITYEGARSVTGPYLAVLGVGATVIGIVSGLGELLGYGLRVVSGRLIDRTGRYWTLTILGYLLNLLAVPLLALAGSWEIAALLIVGERIGKAIRTPARDVMLSYASAATGRGRGFGLHEAMDQIGAVLGPLLVAMILYLGGSYAQGFGVLLAPALVALSVLIIARLFYPSPRSFETDKGRTPDEDRRSSHAYWLYLIFIAVSISGYAHFQLISYHFSLSNVVPVLQIPIFFAIAMAIDALAALAVGQLYDRIGLPILVTVPLLSLPIAPLAFSASYEMAFVSIMLWGAVMGIQETVMRAALADIIPVAKRGSAYGFFNAVYGLSWFVGSILMGALYSINVFYLVAFSIILELVSVLLLVAVKQANRITF
jgi:MFS family permease